MRQLRPKTVLAVTLGCAFPSAKEWLIILARTKPTTKGLSKARKFAITVSVLLDQWYWYFWTNGIGTFWTNGIIFLEQH